MGTIIYNRRARALHLQSACVSVGGAHLWSNCEHDQAQQTSQAMSTAHGIQGLHTKRVYFV